VNNHVQQGLVLPEDIVEMDKEVRMKVFAHAMFGLEQQDICFSKALALIGQLPALVEKADHRGLGHPLIYTCQPLENLIRPELLASAQQPEKVPEISATMIQQFCTKLQVESEVK
jgi:hypothetical protein